MPVIIQTDRLSKTFGQFKAVDNLSFTIEEGDVYGFLGQNGAGKSTTMRMLLGLIYPTAGDIFIKGNKFNNSRRELLKHIGAIIERPDMYNYLSGWDNLRIFASLSGSKITKARLHEVLEIVGLKGREQDKVKAYSQGMKQRLGIAIALVHSPDLMILDEPTNGLDPQGIAEMRQLILHLSKDHGKTILISSHLLYEIQQVANRMLILDKGRKITEGSVNELLNPAQTLVHIRMEPSEGIATYLSESVWRTSLVSATTVELTLNMHPENIPELNQWLVTHGARVLEIQSTHSLEAYFLSLTSGHATDTVRAI